MRPPPQTTSKNPRVEVSSVGAAARVAAWNCAIAGVVAVAVIASVPASDGPRTLTQWVGGALLGGLIGGVLLRGSIGFVMGAVRAGDIALDQDESAGPKPEVAVAPAEVVPAPGPHGRGDEPSATAGPLGREPPTRRGGQV